MRPYSEAVKADVRRRMESFLADGNPGLDADAALGAIEQSL